MPGLLVPGKKICRFSDKLGSFAEMDLLDMGEDD